MGQQRQEHEALVNMRTHLTVLTLVLGQIRRRHGDSEDIGRLCTFGDKAIRQLVDDIADLEALLTHAESRNEPRPHPSPTVDIRSLETGPLNIPSRSPHGHTV